MHEPLDFGKASRSTTREVGELGERVEVGGRLVRLQRRGSDSGGIEAETSHGKFPATRVMIRRNGGFLGQVISPPHVRPEQLKSTVVNGRASSG